MERFFRFFMVMAFLALSLTSSFVPTRITTTRIKQHPQLLLIQRNNKISHTSRTNNRQADWRCYSINEANDNQDSEDTDQNIQTVEVTADSLTPSQIKSLSPDSQTSSFFGALKSFFSNKKNKFNRESLGKLGMSALLAYGFVSNVSGVIAVSSAWFIFCKRVSWTRLLFPVYISSFCCCRCAGWQYISALLCNLITNHPSLISLPIIHTIQQYKQYVDGPFSASTWSKDSVSWNICRVYSNAQRNSTCTICSLTFDFAILWENKKILATEIQC